MRHCRGTWAAGTRRGSGVKGSFSTRDSDMAPMVEEGTQLGESRSPFSTLTHPALKGVRPVFVVVLMEPALVLNCYLWLFDFRNILEIEACEKEKSRKNERMCGFSPQTYAFVSSILQIYGTKTSHHFCFSSIHS